MSASARLIPTPGSPAAMGFRMPAEWERHDATWFAWPHKLESWPGKFDPVPHVYAQIVKALAPHEVVNLNVAGPEMEAEARAILKQHGALLPSVRFHHFPTNDAWTRDHGPIFIVKDSGPGTRRDDIAIVDWKFNSWGDKYPPYDLDNLIPGRIADLLGLRRFEPGIVMEGGSLDVNGRGLLLTTEACLLNENRNPHLDRTQIEQYLCDYLGAVQVLWLGDGIEGDDTDGHIDDLSRFTDEHTIVTVVEDDRADSNHEILKENLERLKTLRDLDGRGFRIETLPMPDPVEFEDQRLPASYANFLIANEVVLLPTFRCAKDKVAAETLQRLFPKRRIVGIDCHDLVLGLGTLHCISQQQPAAYV